MSKIATLLCLTLAGGCTSEVQDADGTGEVQEALTATIHGTADYWRPPEWVYVNPSNATLTQSWAVGDDTPTAQINPGTAYHCGSVLMKVFAPGNLNCAPGHDVVNISVSAAATLGIIHNVSPSLYWQQPNGGAYTTIPWGTVSPSPDSFGWTHTTTPVGIFNPVTAGTWVRSDLGCNGSPEVGMCFTGEPAGQGAAIFSDEVTITVTYTPVKTQ